MSGIVWLLRATFAHFKFQSGLGTKADLILGVSGLDGSGKSTLVDRFIAGIRKAGGEPPQIVHLLPAWIPLPHQLFRRRKTQTNYTRPYSEPPVSSRLNGWLRLGFYLCAFTLAHLSLWLGVKRGRLVIMDRSFLDFASDLTRSRIPAGRLPVWLLRTLMPKGRHFYLDASPEVVVARKGELTLEKARSLSASYRETCNAIGATLLDGDRTADEVFIQLLRSISSHYLRVMHK
jgi:thymidylate kinase